MTAEFPAPVERIAPAETGATASITGPRPVEDLRAGRAQDHRHAAGGPEPRRAAPLDELQHRRARRLVRRQAGRGLRGHGPVRVRQVHADPLPDPPRRAHRRRGASRRRGHRHGQPRPPARAAPPQDVDGVPALRPAARTGASSTTSPSVSRCAARSPRTAGRRPPSSWPWSGSTGRPTATRTSSRAACSSASVWRARWPWTPRSCSSTSRSARSTRSSGGTCRTRSCASTTRWARP